MVGFFFVDSGLGWAMCNISIPSARSPVSPLSCSFGGSLVCSRTSCTLRWERMIHVRCCWGIRYLNLWVVQAKQQKPKQNIIEQVYGYINGTSEILHDGNISVMTTIWPYSIFVCVNRAARSCLELFRRVRLALLRAHSDCSITHGILFAPGTFCGGSIRSWRKCGWDCCCWVVKALAFLTYWSTIYCDTCPNLPAT